jgi:hypothetical protein
MAKMDIAVTDVSPKMAEEWLCEKAPEDYPIPA